MEVTPEKDVAGKDFSPFEQEISDELEVKVKKYLRGEGANLEVLQDKKLKGQLAVREELYGKSAKAAAKVEKWLMPSEGGYLEPEGIEKTWRIKQEDIAREVDILSARNQYDIVLPELGPYTLDFTASGRYMAAAGRKGHLALVDMKNLNLIREIQVRETVRDVVFLHNELFFAVAQKKYPYIYNREGTELHCLKEHGAVLRLQFLKNHFLLAIPGSGEPNFDSWVANPYETSKQRREKEVRSLLDKLPPETIMLDPTKIGTVKPQKKKEKPAKKERETEMEAAVEAAKDVTLKKKTKGRNKPSMRMKKRKEIIENAKRPFLEQQLKGEELSRKKQKVSQESELPLSLQRFAHKKPS
ncbi:U3 small nucleolar RNA-associated protein 7 [Carica papaya]|uniref:U3 small nucleolar RNA-associated protein 7 n=1 Tax=Carica papaya TaxID=3649 RepID=UPI000B8CFED7|nr:U3 small nucleolar RNA-associated protein 7 [Carica papaya]